jgi:hypothetical protein
MRYRDGGVQDRSIQATQSVGKDRLVVGRWTAYGQHSSLDFVLLGREQQNGPARSQWSAICSALEI